MNEHGVPADAEQSGPEEPPATEGHDSPPEQLNARTWVTLVLFAAFVVAFGTCASTFLFR